MMTDNIAGEGLSRRSVVLRLAAAAGFLLVPGAASALVAQKERRKLYAQILNAAIASRDIGAAVQAQRKGLTRQEVQVFLSLTPDELVTLGSFRSKMAKLGVLEVAP
ncbi:MAG TPA: hypothetical protein VFU23_13020 [Gemmatimonadales bacterium]|nr:hypothetical protein [Gemmatimonadales bacterium]